MTKRIFMIVAILLLFTGCGKADAPDQEKNTQQTESQDTSEMQDADTETEVEDDASEETEKSQFTFYDLDKSMYADADVNVRDLPNTDGTKLGGLSKAQEVHVTGQCKETNWYRIEYNGAVGYVSNDYLVEEKPIVDNSSWVKDLKIAEQTTQMIVVSANGTNATVSMHTKDANGVWNENFSVKGRLGRNGIGKEKEGDGKTPIGVFRFTTAFGIKDNPGVSVLPYLKVDETHHWVDDPNSQYYNKCVSTDEVEIDWASSEHLYKYAPSYHYALALNYNEDCVPGVGCAIFLHCPNNSFGTTAGCIAIPEENMIQAMRLLQADCVIIIDSEANIWNY